MHPCKWGKHKSIRVNTVCNILYVLPILILFVFQSITSILQITVSGRGCHLLWLNDIYNKSAQIPPFLHNLVCGWWWLVLVNCLNFCVSQNTSCHEKIKCSPKIFYSLEDYLIPRKRKHYHNIRAETVKKEAKIH